LGVATIFRAEMKNEPAQKTLEPMGLHRTFLFVLAVGLLIAAFRRGGGVSSSDAHPVPPAAQTNSDPGLSAQTNVDTGRGLLSARGEFQK
jgi:hypothetical protein